MSEFVADIWTELYAAIHEDIHSFKVVKPKPSKWVEDTIFLTKDVSRFSGFFKYDVSPYTREVIDCLDPGNPTRAIAIMKCAQSGFTQGVIVPGMAYIISENPDSILFMAGDKELARNTIRTRFDPIIQSSRLSHLIRPNTIRKKNQRTGDTDHSKEYAGGNMIVEGTQNADKMRQFSVKYVFADDWEAAPRADKDEGSLRKLIEGRQTSFGNLAKTFYVSTPTVKQTSNIEPVFELGDQRKWNWPCPHCGTYIPIEWRVEKDDGTFAGIKYKLDARNRVIKESVHYEAQCCGGKIMETEKYELNLAGQWIPTAEPQIEFYRSYLLNALVIPPGFITWVDLVREWVEACPPGQKVDADKLKTFLNIRMGQTWEEMGETPKINQLMQNTRDYLPGIVPDKTIEYDGNKGVVMLTLACDLNGIMEQGNHDVRLDWELVAHTATGVTYSVDQGSIGTFKRKRDRTKRERQTDGDRVKWTYTHGVKNSVWPVFKELIEKDWELESGGTMRALVTVIDTGFFTRLAKQFISDMSTETALVIGVKGSTEVEYRRVNKDTPRVKPSREDKYLYVLEVNQIKDELSSFIKLVPGDDGYQPEGFMNFPQPTGGKYTMKDYFLHYEGEKRVEVVKNERVIGFQWEKKSNQAQNHFWDVRIYNLAAVEIYLDMLRRSDKDLAKITYAEFAEMIFG